MLEEIRESGSSLTALCPHCRVLYSRLDEDLLINHQLPLGFITMFESYRLCISNQQTGPSLLPHANSVIENYVSKGMNL